MCGWRGPSTKERRGRLREAHQATDSLPICKLLVIGQIERCTRTCTWHLVVGLGGRVSRALCERVSQQASFEEQVSKPTLLESDLMKPTLPRELHDAWRLLSAVGGDCSLLPTVAEAMSRASALSLDSSTLNQNAVGHLLRALRTRAQLAPLCAVAGGFAAQQVLIALTGKFSPLRQWVLTGVHSTRITYSYRYASLINHTSHSHSLTRSQFH